MTTRYLQTLFSPAVKAAQTANGSRAAYARHDAGAAEPDRLTADEAAFIAARDSVYLATVSDTGWPYLQHRGGPRGFVRVIDPGTLAFADFRGNRQYLSVGNLATDRRMALFFMDYPQRVRLKVLAHAEVLEGEAAADLLPQVADPSYKAKVERVLRLRVEAFDWNCPQHITTRFSADEIAPVISGLKARITELEMELESARARQA